MAGVKSCVKWGSKRMTEFYVTVIAGNFALRISIPQPRVSLAL